VRHHRWFHLFLKARERGASSRKAAWAYFGVFLMAEALASTWFRGPELMAIGFLVAVLPVLFTWPLVDAAFNRYSREPVADASARDRLHWVYAVLAAVIIALIVGGLRS